LDRAVVVLPAQLLVAAVKLVPAAGMASVVLVVLVAPRTVAKAVIMVAVAA
jgi:hypothetical protein